MWVKFTNPSPIEGYRENSKGPLLFRPLKGGERVTTISLAEGISEDAAFATCVAAVQTTFGVGDNGRRTTPTTVDSDSASLKARLEEHFGLTEAPADPEPEPSPKPEPDPKPSPKPPKKKTTRTARSA